MKKINLVQTWVPMARRKQEYAAFITQEFQPCMKALGLEVDSGWYTLMGGGPSVLVESLAESLGQVETALNDEGFHEMLDRFMSLVTHYGSRVFKQTGWMTMYHWRVPSKQDVKFAQTWDVRPGQHEAYKRFTRKVYLPLMETIGLGVTAAWHLMIGSGRQIFSEALVPNVTSIAEAFCDERFLQLIIRMDELVTNYESRVMIGHQIFLDMLHNLHGRAIREVTLDGLYSMVGPCDE